MADGTLLSGPHYRVEERQPDLATFAVGFATLQGIMEQQM